MDRLRIGLVGCGNIAPIYCENLNTFEETEIVAVADLDQSRAHQLAEKFAIAHVLNLNEMLEDSSIDLILNLTTPGAHAEIAQAAVRAGKHVYNEKSLTIDLEDSDEILATAKKKNVLVGCAPDTVLGAGIQSCRKLIDDGVIGEPLSAQAFMMCPGHESWHPDPEFYYQVGGGPLFDMGPYYLSALVTLLGPVERVCGFAKKSFATRTVTSEPKKGTSFEVDVPTHLVTLMEFAGGAIGQLTTSFDVQHHTLPHIEIYGSQGTMQVPDPNGFGGPALTKCQGQEDWTEHELTHPFEVNTRGLGVLDLALSIQEKRSHRASGELARHVLAIIHATHAASNSGKYVTIETVERPAAMPAKAK